MTSVLDDVVVLSLNRVTISDAHERDLVRRARHAIRARIGRVPAVAHQGPVLVLGVDLATAPSRTWSLQLCAGDVPVDPEESDRRLAPFAELAFHADRGTVEVRTDDFGIRHVYWVQGDGWAGVSTSSAVLAAIAGSDLDEMAIGAFALTGGYLRDETPYRGIRKLDGGKSLTVRSGSVDVGVAPRAPSETIAHSDVIGAGAAAVCSAVEACLSYAPDAAMELSGGLDSRMILAAIPQDLRRGRTAVTILGSDGDDARLAAEIARRNHLRHVVIDISTLEALNPIEAEGLIRLASHRRDHSADPLASAVLDWVESQLDATPRFTGQNGEYARGFFYPAQRERHHPTPDLVARLARWRMFTNDRVDTRLFQQDYLQEVISETVRRITETFMGYDLSWLRATDEYYLEHRMQRWVGAQFSSVCTSHVVLAPFFHPAFVSWARAVEPSSKRDSALFAQVLHRLDPGLADIPLAGRSSPRTIAYPDAVERLGHLFTVGRKALRKVRQRLDRSVRSPGGAAGLSRLQQQAWAERDDALSALANVPFLDLSEVMTIARGDRPADPASVAFLVALEGLATARDAAVPTAHYDLR